MSNKCRYNCYIECPSCGSAKTEVDEFQVWFDQSGAIVPMYCHGCGATWNAIYQFEGNEEVDVLEIKETK